MLEVKKLAISYEKKLICEQISFAAAKGEFLCLLGRNGTGKSSLLRILAGLQKYQKGTILLDNTELRLYHSKQLAHKIALVLNEKLPAEYLKVREVVALGRSPHLNWYGKYQESDEIAIQKAMKITEIENFADRYLHTLSDGERQRVWLARALAQDTPLVILDEATAFLDAYYRKEMIAMLQKIALQEQKCILLATHEIDLALAYAHRLLLLTPQQQFLSLQKWEKSFVFEFLKI
ncbi:MAG: ABC transporter ATP-binding protein [Thermonemataceae bacterium]|nr:ABC transporter ATP-binding protein [Thermonemataceae bacterium]